MRYSPSIVVTARVLDAELLIGRKRAVTRSQKGLRIGDESESVGTARQADDRSSCAQVGTEQHDVFVPMFHHRCVVNGFHRVRNFGLGEDRIVAYRLTMSGLMIDFASSSKIVW